MRETLKQAKRIVVKVGSSVLAPQADQVDRQWLEGLVRQVVELRRQGREIVVVSSGAIACGMGVLGWKRRPGALARLQACAAVGQGQLIRLYEEIFNRAGLHTGQVLLTWEDFSVRKRFVNAKKTFTELLALDIVPVVNENDTISTEELKVGDNDRLSTYVANLIDADLVVILSDVDGVQVRPEARGAEVGILSTITEMTPAIVRSARGAGRSSSTGGMITKLEAAKVANGSGIPLVVANGREPDVLSKILDGELIGTLFVPRGGRSSSRKRWIGYSSKPQGLVVVDAGAKEAILKRGTSLLSRGITAIVGDFDAGDVVMVTDDRRQVFARGQVQFSSEELQRVKGLKSSELEGVLKRRVAHPEAIHRDQLVIRGD